MIEIEILSSPDKDMLGSYVVYKTEIIIGQSKGDIIIQDRELLATHIKLHIKNNSLILTSRSDVSYLFINGKKYIGHVVLKNSDTIKIGNTTLRIIKFIREQADPTKIMQQNIKSIMENNPNLDLVLQDIESDLKYISDHLE